MKKYILYLAGLLSLMACEMDFDIEKYRQEPQIVMYGFFSSSNEYVALQISESWFVTDTASQFLLPGAKALLFVNDEKCDSLIANNSHYISEYKLQAGDKVRMEVSAPELKTAVAETVIPHQVPIDKLETVISSDELHYYLTFSEKQGTSDYYGIRIKEAYLYSDGEEEWFEDQGSVSLNVTSEPLLRSYYSILDDWFLHDDDFRSMYVFSGEKIEGQTYQLHVSVPLHTYGGKQYEIYIPETDKERTQNTRTDVSYVKKRFAVEFFTLSESYYRYLESLHALSVDNFGDWGFAEPVQQYNNVTNGIGMLGAYQVEKKFIYIRTVQ